MRRMTMRLTVSCLQMILWSAAAAVIAADYPSRPIRLVGSSAPGGAADLIARPVAAQMEKQFGYTIVVDNRAGANGAADSLAEGPFAGSGASRPGESPIE